MTPINPNDPPSYEGENRYDPLPFGGEDWNDPPLFGGEDPIDPSLFGGKKMKPERVQTVERSELTDERLDAEYLHKDWEIVDGGLERTYVIGGGFGAAVKFLKSIYACLYVINHYPVATIEGDLVTLRLDDKSGRSLDLDFAIARVIDNGTA